MDYVLAGLQWSSCLIYTDDIIIIGRFFEEHLHARYNISSWAKFWTAWSQQSWSSPANEMIIWHNLAIVFKVYMTIANVKSVHFDRFKPCNNVKPADMTIHNWLHKIIFRHWTPQQLPCTKYWKVLVIFLLCMPSGLWPSGFGHTYQAIK